MRKQTTWAKGGEYVGNDGGSQGFFTRRGKVLTPNGQVVDTFRSRPMFSNLFLREVQHFFHPKQAYFQSLRLDTLDSTPPRPGYQCQRHERYSNQWRASDVRNCTVDRSIALSMAKDRTEDEGSGRGARAPSRRMGSESMRRFFGVSSIGTMPDHAAAVMLICFWCTDSTPFGCCP